MYINSKAHTKNVLPDFLKQINLNFSKKIHIRH